MAYCTADMVRAICDTNITDANITSLITETDAYMDATLDTGSLSATIKQLISRTYTSYVCLRKDPTAQSIGQYSMNRTEAMKMLRADLTKLFTSLGGGGMSFTAASDTLA